MMHEDPSDAAWLYAYKKKQDIICKTLSFGGKATFTFCARPCIVRYDEALAAQAEIDREEALKTCLASYPMEIEKLKKRIAELEASS